MHLLPSVHQSARSVISISRDQGERQRERGKERTRRNCTRTFFPSKKNPKVGVAATPYSRATIEPMPTPKSTLANATWPSPLFAFSRASSSNTGSIILHGGHVADVNIATTARCELSKARNDAGFVDAWIAPASGPGVVVADTAARALVEGAGEL